MSIFDKQISVYRNTHDNRGIVRTIGQFLSPGESERHKIATLRATTDPAIRRSIKTRELPLATMSGQFSPTRKVDNLVSHSGVICIDIDRKDNPDWSVAELKSTLACDPHVAFAEVSVGGGGVFCLIELQHPEEHERQFESLKGYFMQMQSRVVPGHAGITIDAACGDVTRLRCLSYDPAPVINERAATYEGLSDPPTLPAPTVPTYGEPPHELGDDGKVWQYVEACEHEHLNLVGTYDEWVKIGLSLATLGEDGRNPFHHLSRIDGANYNPTQCNRKFDELLKSVRRERMSIAHFYAEAYRNLIHKPSMGTAARGKHFFTR